MSVQSEINRIDSAKDDIREAIISKGVDVPESTKIDGMAAYVAQIQTGSSLRAWTLYDSSVGGFSDPNGCKMPLTDENGETISSGNAESRGTYFIAGFSYSVSLGSDYKPSIGYAYVHSNGIIIQKFGGADFDEEGEIGVCAEDNILYFKFSNYTSANALRPSVFIVKIADD